MSTQSQEQKISDVMQKHASFLNSMKSEVKGKLFDKLKRSARSHQYGNDTVSSRRLRSDFKSVMDVVNEMGLQSRLFDVIFSANEASEMKRVRSKWLAKDAHPSVEAAQTAWMAKQRQTGGKRDPDPTFGCKKSSLLDAISALEPSAPSSHSCFNQERVVPLALRTPSLTQLSAKHKELHPRRMHIGLDDCLEGSSQFLAQRNHLGMDTIERGHTLAARQYLKFGAPASVRPAIWRLALGLSTVGGADERDSYAALQAAGSGAKSNTQERDDLFSEEIFSTYLDKIYDDPIYFPFGESIERLLTAFSRDKWVRENGAVPLHPMKKIDHQSISMDEGNIPPRGSYPPECLVHFIAPLSLVYEIEADAHAVCLNLFARHWCRLSAISTQPGTLLGLCKTFEDILEGIAPELVSHLLRLGVHPLRIAFPWIQTAFSQYLEARELLLLWDRIIGFNDLALLPVLAVSIFVFRSEVLCMLETGNEVESSFADASRLKVVPLLQAILFQGEIR